MTDSVTISITREELLSNNDEMLGQLVRARADIAQIIAVTEAGAARATSNGFAVTPIQQRHVKRFYELKRRAQIVGRWALNLRVFHASFEEKQK